MSASSLRRAATLAPLAAVAVLAVAACSSSTEPTSICVPTDAIPPSLDLAAELTGLGVTVEDLGEPLALLITPARWRSLRVQGVRIEWYQYCSAAIAVAEARALYPDLPPTLGDPPLELNRAVWLRDDAFVWIEQDDDGVAALLTQILGPPIAVFAAGG